MKWNNPKLYRLIWISILLIYVGCTNSDSPPDSASGDSGEYKQQESKQDSQEDGCGIEDGSHSATVEYYNPDTGYSATYDLEVDVEDCQVTAIHFPSGGQLDDSHISPTELDNDGNASVEDDRGRTFEVHIDN